MKLASKVGGQAQLQTSLLPGASQSPSWTGSQGLQLQQMEGLALDKEPEGPGAALFGGSWSLSKWRLRKQRPGGGWRPCGQPQGTHRRTLLVDGSSLLPGRGFRELRKVEMKALAVTAGCFQLNVIEKASRTCFPFLLGWKGES